MKSIIKRSLQSILFVPVLALAASVVMPALQPVTVSAQTSVRDGVNAAAGENKSEIGFFDEGGIFQKITGTLLFIIGAIAVVMIIFGGFKYVTSGGDSAGVTSAKNTILYAVIGLVVAILAWAILDYVLTALGQ